jgi:elongin-A
MTVKCLVDLATQACVKNIRHLDGVGDYLPYETVRNILMRVENGAQLRRIEVNSPQIQGLTGEIWLRLIEKHFPLEFRNKAYKPANPTKWHKVYEKYKREHDAAREESERQLASSLAGLRQHKERNTSRIVDQKSMRGAIGEPTKRRTQDRSGSSLRFGSGSRTGTMSGASVMKKVRREVKEVARIHGSLSKNVGAPKSLTKIAKAPQALIDERRRAALPGVSRSNNTPARKPSAKPTKPSAVTEFEERATFLPDSDDEDNNDMQNDPFDDSPRKGRAMIKAEQRPTATTSGLTSSRAPGPVRGASQLQNKYSSGTFRRPPPGLSEPQSAERAQPHSKSQTTEAKERPTQLDQAGSGTEPSTTTTDLAGEVSPLRPMKRKAPNSIFMQRKR